MFLSPDRHVGQGEVLKELCACEVGSCSLRMQGVINREVIVFFTSVGVAQLGSHMEEKGAGLFIIFVYITYKTQGASLLAI